MLLRVLLLLAWVVTMVRFGRLDLLEALRTGELLI